MSLAFESDKLKPITFSPLSGCNTPDEIVRAQVIESIRRQLPQVQPYQSNGETAIIVASGASLRDTMRELRDCLWSGAKIIALNGAYRWCLEHNLKPSACIILDAREPNAEFIREPVKGCRYLLAAQCHPKAFEYCRDREVFIWHACTGGDEEHDMLKAFYFNRVYPVTLGTTVGIRAISLLRMLGFPRFEIFGLDSCWLNGEHHAFAQKENEKDKRFRVWLRPEGRDDKALSFECAPWHMKQAEDFQTLIRERGNLFQLNVHGPGLIASILRTGAEIQTED